MAQAGCYIQTTHHIRLNTPRQPSRPEGWSLKPQGGRRKAQVDQTKRGAKKPIYVAIEAKSPPHECFLSSWLSKAVVQTSQRVR